MRLAKLNLSFFLNSGINTGVGSKQNACTTAAMHITVVVHVAQ